MSISDMLRSEIHDEELMDWTDEVSPELLRGLFALAARRGVEVTGNCRAVFRYEKAYLKQEGETESDHEGEEDVPGIGDANFWDE